MHVRGYRSLEDLEVAIPGLTSFIGPNGSGKSSLLGALRLFFDPEESVRELDFWSGTSGEAAQEIVIAVTFEDIKGEDRDGIEHLIDPEGLVTVERRFEDPGRGTYLADSLALPQFAEIREAAVKHRERFNSLVDSGEFEGLERASNKEQVFAAMTAWEHEHQDRCEVVSQIVDPDHLFSKIRVLTVGAFEDPEAHLHAEGKGAIGQMLQTLVDRDEVDEQLQEIADDAARQSDEVLSDAKDGISTFTESVEGALQQFAPGFALDVRWEEATVGQARPRLTVDIRSEDGSRRPLTYQGHGVQRSLMYAALTAQVLRTEGDDSSVLLMIEEPEAFQHPLSCQVLARTLRQLSQRNYQVAYSTHSPDFVHADVIEGLRIVRRDDGGRGPATTVHSLSPERLVAAWQDIFDAEGFTLESVQARLGAHLTPQVLEGLFARRCVLVEGDEDEALLRATVLQSGLDLEAAGIAIIQTNGKPGVPNVLGFLSLAGVPCYPVFDLDRELPAKDQHRWAERAIVRALERDGEPEPGVHATYACWQSNLGQTVKDELGESYVSYRDDAAERYGYAPTRAEKVSVVLAEALGDAFQDGLVSGTLRSLAGRMAAFVEEPN